VPNLPSESLEALAEKYARIEAGFRSIQKDLEALPKTPVVEEMIRENIESIASAARNVEIARRAIRRQENIRN